MTLESTRSLHIYEHCEFLVNHIFTILQWQKTEKTYNIWQEKDSEKIEPFLLMPQVLMKLPWLKHA